MLKLKAISVIFDLSSKFLPKVLLKNKFQFPSFQFVWYLYLNNISYNIINKNNDNNSLEYTKKILYSLYIQEEEKKNKTRVLKIYQPVLRVTKIMKNHKKKKNRKRQ